MRLENKVAIVTGAGSGFGEAIAKRFAAEGAKVAVVDINLETATRVANDIGAAAIALKADVASRTDVDAVVSQTVAAFGAPHILINNAGTTYRNQPLLNIDEVTFDRMFDINVQSISHFTHVAVPVMRDNGGGGHAQCRLHGRYWPASRPHLVQCVQGGRESDVEVLGCRIGALADPCQRALLMSCN